MPIRIFRGSILPKFFCILDRIVLLRIIDNMRINNKNIKNIAKISKAKINTINNSFTSLTVLSELLHTIIVWCYKKQKKSIIFYGGYGSS